LVVVGGFAVALVVLLQPTVNVIRVTARTTNVISFFTG
jgi:hypothetical protein